MLHRFFAFTTASLELAVARVAADGLPSVSYVDLARYAGTWHEIARIPNCFQRSCALSQADHTPCADGSLEAQANCLGFDVNSLVRNYR